MDWKRKARVQSLIARLPFAESIYRQIQRLAGKYYKETEPLAMLRACSVLARKLHAHGGTFKDAHVLEVGTGQQLHMPFGFFLLGARRVTTFDLNHRLSWKQVLNSLVVYRERAEEIVKLFSEFHAETNVRDRLDWLCQTRNFSDLEFLDYRAPGDASKTGRPENSFDIHVSYTVFEHIPRDVLKAILLEAVRVLRPGGYAIHHIDLSDHCSHADPSITAINFLQFSEREWQALAGNRFAFHNRMRSKEYLPLFDAANFQVVEWERKVDSRSHQALCGGFRIADQFKQFPSAVLCDSRLVVVARKPLEISPGTSLPSDIGV